MLKLCVETNLLPIISVMSNESSVMSFEKDDFTLNCFQKGKTSLF
jgi:hypothetical protein